MLVNVWISIILLGGVQLVIVLRLNFFMVEFSF